MPSSSSPSDSDLPQPLQQALDRTRATPEDDSAWDALDEAARDADRPEEASQLYRDVLASDLDAEVLLRIGRRAVAFHEEWYEDSEHEIGILKRLSTLAGGDWAFERLTLLFTMSERWDELLAEYDRKLAYTVEPERRLPLLDEAARIAKDFAGQGQRASDYLKERLLSSPDDRQLAEALERRLERQHRHQDLIDIWGARLGSLSKEEALATRLQIAERQLNEIGDAAAALQVTEEILEGPDGHAEACRLLEQIAERPSAAIDARQRALEILRERYALAEQGPDVIRILQLALSIADDDVQRRDLHAALVRWLTQCERHAEAMDHAGALFSLSPDSIEAQGELRALAKQTGRSDAYAAALVAAARTAGASERRLELWVEAGKVFELELHDPEQAIALYQQVLDDSRAADAQQLFAARRLRQLLGEGGDDQARRLLAVLERLSVLEPNQRGRRHVLGEAAVLADRLSDLERALELWQRCLDADQTDLTPLDARIALLERAERWTALIEDLRRRARALDQPEARRADLVRIARIYETRLFRLEQAIEVWSEVEREFGSTAETIDALVDLSAAAGRYSDVAARLEAAIQSETDAHRRTDQLSRLGDVYREQEKAPGKAIELYRQALELNPLHEAARSGLRALIGSEPHGRDAVETLAVALESADEWPGVLELVEIRVRASGEIATARRILLEAANILELRAQDPSGALAYLCRAFELEPSGALEGELDRLARMSGEWSILVSGYQRAIERTSDPARALALRQQRAQILEERIEDREAALSSYRQILDIAPDQADAARAVARVGVKQRAWNDVAWAFVANAAALGHVDPNVTAAIERACEGNAAWEYTTQAILERIEGSAHLGAKVLHDLRRTLGIWYRDHRRDTYTAETLFRQAVQSHRNADTLRLLAELQRQQPGRALVETLQELSEECPDDLGVLHEAARVAFEVVGDSALAEPIARRSLSAAGAAMSRIAAAESASEALGSEAERIGWWSIEALVKLEKERGGLTEALRLLMAGAALPFPPERSVQLAFDAATLAVDALGDSARAVEICRGILGRAPDHRGALELLAKLYESSGQYAELLDLRRRELELAPPLERRLSLRLDEARISSLLGEPAALQIQVLRDNVAESPGHAQSIDELSRLLAPEDGSALFELLAEQARAVAELGREAESAALWARAGIRAESRGDVASALAAYEESVRWDARTDVLDALGRLSSARGDHVAAIGWLERRLAVTPEGAHAERQRTLLLLAEAARASGQDERARAYLSDGLAQDPRANELRKRLADAYRAEQRWELLAPLLAEGADNTDDPALSAEFLRNAALVRREHLGQLHLAIPLLERAAEIEPRDRALRLSLADALREAGRHEDARRLLTSLLEEFGRRRTPERARIHYQLAQTARALGELDVALRELDLASKVDRDNIQILQLLGEVAREKGQLEEAERAYRTLLLLLGRSRPRESDGPVVGESAILFELYRIASELGQQERAKDLLDSALEAGAHDLDEAKRLEQALREAGHHDLLLRALEQRSARTTAPLELAALHQSRAEALLALGQREAALDSRIEALRHDPAKPELVRQTLELAAGLGKVELVATEVSRLAEHQAADDPELACELWLALGASSEALGDLAAAAKFYVLAQKTGMKPLECLDAIERVGIGDDPEALARALTLFIDNADPDVARERYTEALYRLGTLDLYQGRPEQAVRHLDVALTRNGDTERVLGLLAASLTVTAASEPVIELLERIARDENDGPRLLLALTHAAKLRCASLDALHEAVDLARTHGDEGTVRSLLEATVELARDTGQMADATWAVFALADNMERSGQARAAVDLLQESIAHSTLQDAFELRLRLAGLAQNPLGDFELAATVYERLLAEEPTSPRVFKPLFDIYRKMGDREKLETRISAIERAVDDPALRHALRLERLRILIDSKRNAEAEAALKAILDEDPASDEALQLLESLLDEQGRSAELSELIERRLDTARRRGDRAAIASYTLRLAKILAASDAEAAIDVYRASLEACGDHRELLESFLGLLREERHAPDRAAVLERLIGIEDGDAAEARTLELVALHKAQDDFSGVERALELGLGRVPASEALHAERVQWYRQHDAWAELAGALCDHAKQLEHPFHRRDQIEQAALIFEVQLGDPRKAALTLEQAADAAAPDPALLAKIAQHWLAANEPNRALAHLSEAIRLHRSEDQSLGALLQLRGNLHRQLGDHELANLDAAIADLEHAVRLIPSDARADLEAALEQKLARLAHEPSPESDEERGRTTLALARVLAELEDVAGATSLVDAWVKEHPSDKAGQLELGRLALLREDYRTAAEAFRGLLPLSAGEERVAVTLKLAEACEKLGEPLAAKEALEQAHAEFPGEEAIRRRLRKMYQAAKAYRGWANMLMADAANVSDKQQRFDLLCNAGDLYRQVEGGALEEAREAYIQAVAIEDDAKTLVKLVDVEVQLGHIEDAANRLDEAIRSHGKRRSPDLSVLQHAMARVATAAGDEEAVFAWLEAALYSDRQNGAVASELATLAMARGEYDVAIKALQLVTLLKHPGPMSRAEAYLRQAAIAKQRGDVKKSALLAKRAITTDPDYAEAKTFLDELQVSGDSLAPQA